MTAIVITRAGPLCTIQDVPRTGMLRHGISASGPMDAAAYARAGRRAGGAGGIEFTTAGVGFVVEGGAVGAGLDGGAFTLSINGAKADWPALVALKEGARVEITPGAWGNYGYVRFDRDLNIVPVLGSRTTNSIARLGGLDGRALRAGDRVELGSGVGTGTGSRPEAVPPADGPIRVVWGLHADLFATETRARFSCTASPGRYRYSDLPGSWHRE